MERPIKKNKAIFFVKYEGLRQLLGETNVATVPACNVPNVCSFFFNDTANTEIYTLSLHDALPISHSPRGGALRAARARVRYSRRDRHPRGARRRTAGAGAHRAARAGRRANLKHGSCVTTERILEGLARREPAALARAITLVENQRDGFEQVLSHAHGLLGRGSTRRVGITGPPGAGKSTLTEALIQRFRARRLSVGVVAVDPTSPFTGGALLGDRIRMESVSLDPGVLICSRHSASSAY